MTPDLALRYVTHALMLINLSPHIGDARVVSDSILPFPVLRPVTNIQRELIFRSSQTLRNATQGLLSIL